MRQPKKVKGTELCITVTGEGVTVYGNKQMFRSLAEWFSWIAGSKPSEHYECHVVWHLMSKFAEKKNVTVLYDEKSAKLYRKHHPEQEFELTFMLVEPRDLKKLRSHEEAGVLPEDWNL
jgi:hypothetical protein